MRRVVTFIFTIIILIFAINIQAFSTEYEDILDTYIKEISTSTIYFEDNSLLIDDDTVLMDTIEKYIVKYLDDEFSLNKYFVLVSEPEEAYDTFKTITISYKAGDFCARDAYFFVNINNGYLMYIRKYGYANYNLTVRNTESIVSDEVLKDQAYKDIMKAYEKNRGDYKIIKQVVSREVDFSNDRVYYYVSSILVGKDGGSRVIGTEFKAEAEIVAIGDDNNETPKMTNIYETICKHIQMEIPYFIFCL